MGILPVFQSPLNILCEISNIQQRASIIGYACICWSLGQCIVPLIAFLLPNWKILKVISMVPFVLILFTWWIFPESPRWLISKGRTTEASEILRKVAKINRIPVPPTLDQDVIRVSKAVQEKTLGYLSLFSSPTMAIRTFMVIMGYTAGSFVYYQVDIAVVVVVV